jgi:hypothetical protein
MGSQKSIQKLVVDKASDSYGTILSFSEYCKKCYYYLDNEEGTA